MSIFEEEIFEPPLFAMGATAAEASPTTSLGSVAPKLWRRPRKVHRQFPLDVDWLDDEELLELLMKYLELEP